MHQTDNSTRAILENQLRSLREDFHRRHAEDLFRMYLHYMVEFQPEQFERLVTRAAERVGS
ncbi:hypothetical protein LLH00_19610 [bacterium]|nr:hypothetical protein [bacterium]